MKIFLILLINFLFLSFVNSVETQPCLDQKVNNQDDCNKIEIKEMDESMPKIACCFVKYKSEDEGKIQKCVPIYKTINGLHMHKEQLKNMGGTSISIECSAQRVFNVFQGPMQFRSYMVSSSKN